MFGSAVHSIAFAQVAVLCVCMVTSATDSSTVQTKSFTNGPGLNVTVPGDTDTLEQNMITPDAVTSTDNQPPQGTFKTSDQQNVTHHEHSSQVSFHPVTTHNLGNAAEESPENKSTTTESTTAKATTTKATTTKTATTEATSGGKLFVDGNVADNQHNSSRAGGIFFLFLIIVIIFILAVVLYVLWKKGKRYSFDLTNGEHDTPLRSMEHTGIFEPSKGSTMNLDYVQEEKTNKTSPVANGCPGETPDQSPCSEHQNDPEEDSFSCDLSLDLPVKKVEFNLDLELIGGDPEPAKEPTLETTDNDNENNNNDTNTGIDSADFFTEINLDDAQ
ncbi:uncharacterized protein LOC128510220 [Clarias gariepinus]|uniref:uncharacterized protein LOC128510220 n=1 Tax=Clarias gariepinus TaxID=13013 RepID=UPI00234CF289|nr:uncharacterized protein LOC128510220 [Clarias gariepinus]